MGTAGTILRAVRRTTRAGREEAPPHLLGDDLAETAVDVTFPPRRAPRGVLHPFTRVRRDAEDFFLGLGYEVVDGREVETPRFTFDLPGLPAGHLARRRRRAFYIDDDSLLRTTAWTAVGRALETRRPPLYLVSSGRVYRREATGVVHGRTFSQLAGLALDEHITLADLKGTVADFVSAILDGEGELAWRVHPSSFADPAVALDVTCLLCDGLGCRVCKERGRVELGVAGLLTPAVLERAGHEAEHVSGFSFVLGIDRIALERHRAPSVRSLWTSDVAVLRRL